MSLHSCVPQSMTPERLAAWIKENSIDTQIHEKKIPLDEETTKRLNEDSALASRAIMRLMDKKKEFMEFLNEGTPVTVPPDALTDPEMQPVSVTIPPTKGLKALKKNLEYADRQLEDGFSIEETEVYMIPYPEASLVVGVTITGEEFFDDADRSYSRSMSDEEVENMKPLLKEIASSEPKPKKEKKVKKSFIEEEAVSESGLDI